VGGGAAACSARGAVRQHAQRGGRYSSTLSAGGGAEARSQGGMGSPAGRCAQACWAAGQRVRPHRRAPLQPRQLGGRRGAGEGEWLARRTAVLLQGEHVLRWG
jgi:hypothetical protein